MSDTDFFGLPQHHRHYRCFQVSPWTAKFNPYVTSVSCCAHRRMFSLSISTLPSEMECECEACASGRGAHAPEWCLPGDAGLVLSVKPCAACGGRLLSASGCISTVANSPGFSPDSLVIRCIDLSMPSETALAERRNVTVFLLKSRFSGSFGGLLSSTSL